jgi:hypothetical protein
VPVGTDACPGTAAGAVVDDVGCSVDQLCPCENEWKNHGQYVSCVSNATNELVEAGIITEDEAGVIKSAAGKSDCGKKETQGRRIMRMMRML